MKASRKRVEGRFFIEEDLTAGEVPLPPGESGHAAKSKRLKPGDRVEVFNGRGASRIGAIDGIHPGALTVRFLEPLQIEEAPAHRLTLAVSPPKGDRMSWMVEKLTELGADVLVPTVYQRSLDAGVRVATAKAARWRRTAVEAAKQCGRNFLLEVRAPIMLDGLLKESARFDLGIVLGPAHPGAFSLDGGSEKAPPLGEIVKGLQAVPAETLVLVGPEGGVSPEESERIRAAGLKPASLGSRILRIETAAMAAAAVLRPAWD